LSSRTPLHINELINLLKQLPLIGEKTAIRIAFHLIKNKELMAKLRKAIEMCEISTGYCSICNLPAESQVCNICSDEGRDKSVVCVVADPFVAFMIERTGMYKGIYYNISPITDEKGNFKPENININHMRSVIDKFNVKEVILMLSPTPEGDATAYLIRQKLKDKKLKVTMISRGVSYGSDLAYYDPAILIKAMSERQDFNTIFKSRQSKNNN